MNHQKGAQEEARQADQQLWPTEKLYSGTDPACLAEVIEGTFSLGIWSDLCVVRAKKCRRLGPPFPSNAAPSRWPATLANVLCLMAITRVNSLLASG
jgi:hypothetical protein